MKPVEFGNRLEPSSISESIDRAELSGPILDIDPLQDYLRDKLEAVDYVPLRIKVIAAEAGKSRLYSEPPEVTQEKGIEPSRQRVLSELFLDSALLLGHHQMYLNHNRRRMPAHKSPITHQQLLQSIEAGKRMQGHIHQYLELFAESSNGTLYEGLQVVIDDARRLIYGEAELPEWTLENNDRNLGGLLAECKVVRALKSAGWQQAQHTPAEMDAHAKVDVFVPATNGHDRTVLLQVKQRRNPESPFGINGRKEVPEVKVPMNNLTDPFDLTDVEVSELSEFVALRAAA